MALFTLISMRVGCAPCLSSLPSKQDLSTPVQSTLQSSPDIAAEMPSFQELDLPLPPFTLSSDLIIGSVEVEKRKDGSLAASLLFQV